MKSIYTIAFCLLALAGITQTAPKLINYQGVARNGQGVPIASKSIKLKFEIKDALNATLFTETQTVLSNALGLFNTQIGKEPGSNLDLNQWSNGPFSLTVGIDTANGTSFTTFAAQQLASVPYALYSNSAGSVPSANLSFDNNTKILSVGQGTVMLPSSGTPPSPTLSVDGTGKLTVTPGGGSIFLSGTNAVTVTPTTGTTGGYNIDAPKVTVRAAISPGPLTPGLPPSGDVIGLAQVFGTFPNFSVVVAPLINYSQNTGYLTLSNNDPLEALFTPTVTPQPYSVGYDITPKLILTGSVLKSGPSSNSIDLEPLTPWRYNAGASRVTLFTPTSNTLSVGINTATPGCALDVAGYTKLGGGASGTNIQVVKLTGTTNAAQGFNIGINLPTGVTQNKILSVTVLVDVTNNNSGDWIHPNYTYLGLGYQFNWRITTNQIFVENMSGNSANILSKPFKVMITYEQ